MVPCTGETLTPKRKAMRTWQRVGIYSLIVVLAVAATIFSFQFKRPANCANPCVPDTEYAPCPPNCCEIGEQRAGFPFIMVRDNPGGGSPTGGWGKLGAEDYLYMNLGTFLLNVGFYGTILWVLWKLPSVLHSATPFWQQKLLVGITYIGFGVVVGVLDYEPEPAWNPPTTIDPEIAILDIWYSTGLPSDEVFVFVFDGEGMQVSHGSDYYIGRYTWVNTDTLQLVLNTDIPVYSGEIATCDRLPKMLAEVCQFQVSDPTPVPTRAVGTPQPLPPANATPMPTATSYIPADEVLHIAIDAPITAKVGLQTLTLSMPSGYAQKFERESLFRNACTPQD